MAQKNGEMLVYVGTYNRGREEGIYVCRLDTSSGALQVVSTVKGVQNPSFLALHPTRRYLYAVSESGGGAAKTAGAVSSFSIDPKTGALTLMNQQSSGGPGPCHLSVDQTGRFVLVANYSGGSVAILPLREDGQVEPATDFIQHQGSSVNPRRQDGPHAHSIMIAPNNRCAYVPDLGMDKVMIYRIDLERGKLVPNTQPWVQVQAGAGPRHFDFHPNGKYAYVIDELDSTVVAFAYDAAQGTLKELQVATTLPSTWKGTNYPADVHVAPSGKFLYGSNRGYDSIAIFAIDQDTGKLTLIGQEPTQGEYPRNFGIDPTGTLMLVANQNTDNIVAYRIDQQSGKLTPTGAITVIPMAVCVKFMSLAG